jgi:hypothetical protein
MGGAVAGATGTAPGPGVARRPASKSRCVTMQQLAGHEEKEYEEEEEEEEEEHE